MKRQLKAFYLRIQETYLKDFSTIIPLNWKTILKKKKKKKKYEKYNL